MNCKANTWYAEYLIRDSYENIIYSPQRGHNPQVRTTIEYIQESHIISFRVVYSYWPGQVSCFSVILTFNNYKPN